MRHNTKKYISTNPLLWLVVLVVAWLVILNYQDAATEHDAARQHCYATAGKELCDN